MTRGKSGKAVNEPSALPQVVAAIDLGSNSIKMTVACQQPNGRIEEILSRSETVRLGAGVDTTGQLADDRMAAALSTLTRFAAEARAAGAGRIVAVATEAVRIATNGSAFLDRVARETGIEIRAISGAEEAHLTFRGLANEADLTGRVLVADVGGGSTEVIAADDGNMTWFRSLPLGSGRLTDQRVHHDPPTAPELAECRREAARRLDDTGVPTNARDRLIVLGGTGEYFMRLLPYGGPAEPRDVDRVLDSLTTTPAAVLAEKLAIPLERARVLPAGIAIVGALSDWVRPRQIEGARSGIRLGLLLAVFAGEI